MTASRPSPRHALVIGISVSAGIVLVVAIAMVAALCRRRAGSLALSNAMKRAGLVDASGIGSETHSANAGAWRFMPRRFKKPSDGLTRRCISYRSLPAAEAVRPRLGYASDIGLDKPTYKEHNAHNHSDQVTSCFYEGGRDEPLDGFISALERASDVVQKGKGNEWRLHDCAHFGSSANFLVPIGELTCSGLVTECNAVAVALSLAVPKGYFPFDVFVARVDLEGKEASSTHASVPSALDFGVSMAAFAQMGTKSATGRSHSALYESRARTVECTKGEPLRLPRPTGMGDGEIVVAVRFWHHNNPRAEPLRDAMQRWYASLGRDCPSVFGRMTDAAKSARDDAFPDEESRDEGRLTISKVSSTTGDTSDQQFLQEGASVLRPGRVDVESRNVVSPSTADAICALVDDWPTVLARDGLAWESGKLMTCMVPSRLLCIHAPSYRGLLTDISDRLLDLARDRGWKEHTARVNVTHPYGEELAAFPNDEFHKKAKLVVHRIHIMRRTMAMAYHADTSRLVPLQGNDKDPSVPSSKIVDFRHGMQGGLRSMALPSFAWFANHSPFLTTTGVLPLKNVGITPDEAATEIASGGGRVFPANVGDVLFMEGGVNCVHRITPFFQERKLRARYNIILWFSLKWDL